MSFGGGKSKGSNKSKSKQMRDAFGMDTSSAFGTSGQFDTSQNIGSAWNQAMQQSFVDPTQSPHLKQLYAAAMGTYNKAPNITALASDIVNPMLKQGQQAYGNLIGLSDPTAQIAAQEASLKSGLSDLFGQGTLGVKSAATNAGAFGGSRHALEQAALGGEVAKAFTQGRGDIVANANQLALQAAQAAPGAASQLAQLGLVPESLRFANLQQLSGLLGSPTILSSGTSGGGSFNLGSSFGAGKSQNIANSLGINMEQARAISKASGKEKSGNFNFGFI